MSKDERSLPDKVWPHLENIRRQYWYWPSTFSLCPACETNMGRGYGLCTNCYKAHLVKLGIDGSLVDNYIQACEKELDAWDEVMNQARSMKDDKEM